MHGETQLQQEEKEEEVEEERMVKEEAAKQDSQEEEEEERKKEEDLLQEKQKGLVLVDVCVPGCLVHEFVDHIEDSKVNHKDHNRLEQELSDNFHKSALDKRGNTQERKFKQFRKRTTAQTQNPDAERIKRDNLKKQ